MSYSNFNENNSVDFMRVNPLQPATRWLQTAYPKLDLDRELFLNNFLLGHDIFASDKPNDISRLERENTNPTPQSYLEKIASCLKNKREEEIKEALSTLFAVEQLLKGLSPSVRKDSSVQNEITRLSKLLKSFVLPEDE
jgi:hypothetical protein